MSMNSDGTRPGQLVDCPYCEGEGTDADSPLGMCVRCYGTGRVAHFLAERTLARWARIGRRAAVLRGPFGHRPDDGGDDGLGDEAAARFA